MNLSKEESSLDEDESVDFPLTSTRVSSRKSRLIVFDSSTHSSPSHQMELTRGNTSHTVMKNFSRRLVLLPQSLQLLPPASSNLLAWVVEPESTLPPRPSTRSKSNPAIVPHRERLQSILPPELARSSQGSPPAGYTPPEVVQKTDKVSASNLSEL